MKATVGGVKEYARRLNDTGWLTVPGEAYALFLTVGLLRFLAPEEWRDPARAQSLALPTIRSLERTI
jgi:hypothetical protein